MNIVAKIISDFAHDAITVGFVTGANGDGWDDKIEFGYVRHPSGRSGSYSAATHIEVHEPTFNGSYQAGVAIRLWMMVD